MKHLKRMLSLLLSLALATGLLPVFVQTAHAAPGDDFQYTSDGTSITITGYTGLGTSVVIPGIIEDKPVTTIEASAFFKKNAITDITIPASVATIGNDAFNGCDALAKATFGGIAPTTFGSNVFDGTAAGFTIYYPKGAERVDGWSTPTWNGYPTAEYSFKATFDPKNGSAVTTKDAEFDTLLTKPEDPGKTGYTFEGWYKEEVYATKWNFDTDKVTSDITLYAKWSTAKFTVNFSTGEGSSVASLTAEYNSTISKPAKPARNGYVFDGWYKDDTFKNAWDFGKDKVTTDTTLYAKWVQTIQININCSKTDVTVYGEANGTITITAAGGNSGSFLYSIDGVAGWQDPNSFGGLAAGTYSVWVQDKLYPENSGTATVTISQPRNTGCPANKMPSKVNMGTAITITIPAQPRNYRVTSVAYASSNTTIAPINPTGNVTFLRGGTVRITMTLRLQITSRKGAVSYKTTRLTKSITICQPVSNITLNASEKNIQRTQTFKLTANAGPSTASNRKVTWSSSNTKVATVSGSGLVSGRGAGTAVITCTAQDGSRISASCTINVTQIYPTSIKISKSSVQLAQDGTVTLKATVAPRNADSKGVQWDSSNTSVATVDGRGRVKALTAGTAVISARASNGVSSTCLVTVSMKPLTSYGKFTCAGMSAGEYQTAMQQAWTKVNTQGDAQTIPINLQQEYTYADLENIMVNLARNEGVELYILGRTAQGRNIYSLSVDYKPNAGKKVILLTGEIHAREFAGSLFILKELSELIEQAKTDAYAESVLESVKFVAIPVVNPDGREIIRIGGDNGRKSNMRGVDLNRNFPSISAGQQAKGVRRNRDYAKKPGLDYYAGDYLGSENETKAVMKWMDTYVPSATYLIDYHQQGHQVYGGKPWDSSSGWQAGWTFAQRILGYLNAGKTSGKYIYQPEYNHYGLDGAGGSLTDYAMSIAAGMRYSPYYGRMVLVTTDGRELPLIVFRNLDRYAGLYTRLNPGFTTASIEIGKGGAYLGYTPTARNLMDAEYTNYRFGGLLALYCESALGH